MRDAEPQFGLCQTCTIRFFGMVLWVFPYYSRVLLGSISRPQSTDIVSPKAIIYLTLSLAMIATHSHASNRLHVMSPMHVLIINFFLLIRQWNSAWASMASSWCHHRVRVRFNSFRSPRHPGQSQRISLIGYFNIQYILISKYLTPIPSVPVSTIETSCTIFLFIQVLCTPTFLDYVAISVPCYSLRLFH